MRSTNPTRFLLKRNLFIGVIVFLAIFFILPFWGLSHIPSQKDMIMQHHAPESLEKDLTDLVSVSAMTAPANLETMVILYGGLGFLTAMMLMRHLFSRRQGMLHAALPDKRETDFLRRLIAYAALCVSPIVMNLLIYLLVIAFNNLLGFVDWGKLLGKFGILLLINLYGFSMGLLSSILTGTYWAAVLAGGVLIAGMEGMALIWYYLAGRYLHTMVETGFRETLLSLSPSFSLYKGFYRPDEFVWLPGLTAIVIALGLSFLLYRVRKTEAAEKTLAFGWLHVVMGFVLPVMGGSLLGVIVLMSFGSEVSLIAGMASGALLSFWLCRIVFHQRFCGILRQWYLPAASITVLVFGVFVLHTDLLGYDHFLPQREKLTSVTYHSQSYLRDEVITLSSEEVLDAMYDWCTLMRDEVDGLDNGVGQSDSAESSSSVLVTYHLGDHTVYRRYPNRDVRNQAQSALKTILESDDFRQSLLARFVPKDLIVCDLYLNSRTSALRDDDLFERFGVYANYMNLQQKDDFLLIEKWLSALEKDLLARTFEEKKENALFSLQLHFMNPQTNVHTYKTLSILSGDRHFLEAVFGDKAEEIVAYATGGYASDEDIVVLKITHSMSRREIARQGLDSKKAVSSVTAASSPEEAGQWLRNAQPSALGRYYFMPDQEDSSFSSLYFYRMNDVEKYSSLYGYSIPEDVTQFYWEERIPVDEVLDMIGE